MQTINVEDLFLYFWLSVGVIYSIYSTILCAKYMSIFVFYKPKNKRNLNNYSIVLTRRLPTNINDNRIVIDNRRYVDSAIIGDE